jgi:stage II sporulation protein AA (anti-sigma F factor antagonist)
MTTARVQATRDDGLVRIVMAGEVDLANADLVQRDLTQAISNQVTAVSVDMSAVDYIDSAGLRVLFLLAERLATLQIHVELVAPAGSPARRVLEISGLGALVTLEPPDKG